MKPARIKAERERKAKREFYKIARKIPNNAVLSNILLSIQDQPIREGFLRNVKPHLRKGVWVELESLIGNDMP
jgi:benzoyl-CoA reductase/2-hydroxyglutaryl-CoA dehydratase subunit BcrC/BadD/HgdB